MDEALDEWKSLLDDTAFDIWKSSTKTFRKLSVLIHLMNKEYNVIQLEFSYNNSNIVNTPTANKETVERMSIGNNALESPQIIFKDSPIEFNENSFQFTPCKTDVSMSMNASSILNNNVLEFESDLELEDQIKIIPIMTSPVINKGLRKKSRKFRVPYMELNKTAVSNCSFKKKSAIEKDENNLDITVIEDNIGINDNRSNSKYFNGEKAQMDNEFDQKASNCIDLLTPDDIESRFTNITNVFEMSTDVISFQKSNNPDDFLVNVSKENPPVFQIRENILQPLKNKERLSLQTKKLEKTTLIENCKKCGNFGGFEDLSSNMFKTKNYVCKEHRKLCLSDDTPPHIWDYKFH